MSSTADRIGLSVSDPFTDVEVVDLKADSIREPLGLESSRPKLSWRLESQRRNVRQTAFRILVATSEAALSAGAADLWDSGTVASAKSFGIEYGGRALSSRLRCWWCVRVWDDTGMASQFSASSWWEMGLLNQGDWSAEWLAVEDAIANMDRKSGLHWIWGSCADNERSRKFRFALRLPARTRTGEFFVVVNSAFANEPTDNIVNAWIDGKPVIAALLQGRRMALEPLSAGTHLIAVEVKPVPQTNFADEHSRQDGFTFFARLEMENGELLRVGSQEGWRTSLTADTGWFLPRNDSDDWEPARPVAIENYQPWPPLPAMYLRREFSVRKPLLRARLYATALGVYEARINGNRVGDARLTPEISQYARRVLYQVYDVGAQLQPGMNALGLLVGDGWYANFDGLYAWHLPPRRVLAQLELTFVDGSMEVVVTGPGWRIAQSPVRVSEIRAGEIYDARLEQPGWDTHGFDASHWMQAEIGHPPPCRRVAQTSPPIVAVDAIEPQVVSQPNPGVYVADFGQNFAGWCRLRASGDAGARIELRFGELLTESGEVDECLGSIGEPKRDVFILRGAAGGETCEPHFTYRGFRYVQITGLSAPPTRATLQGIVAHSDLRKTGHLVIDHPVLDGLWRCALWSQRSNSVAIPTDCPSREQRGWMADAGFFWDAAAYNMDVCAFTRRQIDNAVDDQAADGALPPLAPEPARMKASLWWWNGGTPAWGDAPIALAWLMWQRYGDLTSIEHHWDAMNRHLQLIERHNPDYIWNHKRGADLGDWFALGEIPYFNDPNAIPTTPKDLIGTAYWAHSTDLLAQMAEAIGRKQEAQRLHALSGRIRRAFADVFTHTDGAVGNGSQTSYVLALKFKMLPEGSRRVAAARLAAQVRQRGVALTTGTIGTQFIVDVLADEGYVDLAYGLLMRTEFPSWGYMIRNGATAIWETWSGDQEFRGRVIRASRNHYALGSVCGFLYRRVAGIEPALPGFTEILIRPALDSRVSSAEGEYESVMGHIRTRWARVSQRLFTLDVTIPANTTARVHLPAARADRIEESGANVGDCPVIKIERSAATAVVAIGSGAYRFSVHS